MTGEDLWYKPGVVEKGKLEYSPLGKVLNKVFKEDDKKEGLLKRLKIIEDKNKGQSGKIEDQGERQLDMINKQEKKQLEATKSKNSD